MDGPCYNCKERRVGCHAGCEKYKVWKEWRDCVKQNELAVKELRDNLGAVKVQGMKRVGKQINER